MPGPTHDDVTALLRELLAAGTVQRLDLLGDALERTYRHGHRDGLTECVQQQLDRR